MANTYLQIYIHIVFSTKLRAPVLAESNREKLFRYIWGINKNLNCHLYRVNGVEDHIHILTSVHPTVSIADYVKAVKTGSTKWIKTDAVFPGFTGWQDGYGAFGVSPGDKNAVIEYIKGQVEHHRTVSYLDEMKVLLREAGIAYDERFLE